MLASNVAAPGMTYSVNGKQYVATLRRRHGVHVRVSRQARRRPLRVRTAVTERASREAGAAAFGPPLRPERRTMRPASVVRQVCHERARPRATPCHGGDEGVDMNKRLRVTVVVIAADRSSSGSERSRDDRPLRHEHGWPAPRSTPGSYTIKTTLNTRLEVPRPKGTTTATGTLHRDAQGGQRDQGDADLEADLRAPDGSRARGARPSRRAREGRQDRRPALRALPLGSRTARSPSRPSPRSDDRRQGVRERPHEGEPGRRDPRPGQGEGRRRRRSGNPYANIVVAATPALVAQGKTLSNKFGCEGCHTLTGEKSTGPTWKGLAGRNVRLTTGKP